VALISCYGGIALGFIFVSKKTPIWFAAVLAIVTSQTMLFGGAYVYFGRWECALIISSVMCIVTKVATNAHV
jgi:Mn2+/Fe2+ NRAMP family transporter